MRLFSDLNILSQSETIKALTALVEKTGGANSSPYHPIKFSLLNRLTILLNTIRSQTEI
jgi:hypothetical protein